VGHRHERHYYRDEPDIAVGKRGISGGNGRDYGADHHDCRDPVPLVHEAAYPMLCILGRGPLLHGPNTRSARPQWDGLGYHQEVLSEPGGMGDVACALRHVLHVDGSDPDGECQRSPRPIERATYGDRRPRHKQFNNTRSDQSPLWGLHHHYSVHRALRNWRQLRWRSCWNSDRDQSGGCHCNRRRGGASNGRRRWRRRCRRWSWRRSWRRLRRWRIGIYSSVRRRQLDFSTTIKNASTVRGSISKYGGNFCLVPMLRLGFSNKSILSSERGFKWL